MVAAVEDFDLKLTGPAGDDKVAVATAPEDAADVLSQILADFGNDGINHSVFVLRSKAIPSEECRQGRQMRVGIPHAMVYLGKVDVGPVEVQEQDLVAVNRLRLQDRTKHTQVNLVVPDSLRDCQVVPTGRADHNGQDGIPLGWKGGVVRIEVPLILRGAHEERTVGTKEFQAPCPARHSGAYDIPRRQVEGVMVHATV